MINSIFKKSFLKIEIKEGNRAFYTFFYYHEKYYSSVCMIDIILYHQKCHIIYIHVYTVIMYFYGGRNIL